MEAMLPYLNEEISEDDFHEIIQICLSENRNSRKSRINCVRLRIDQFLKEQRKVQSILYNSRRNISLNQCIGESKTPVSDWLDLDKYL